MLRRARAAAALVLTLSSFAEAAGRNAALKLNIPPAGTSVVPTASVPLIPSLGGAISEGKIIKLPVAPAANDQKLANPAGAKVIALTPEARTPGAQSAMQAVMTVEQGGRAQNPEQAGGEEAQQAGRQTFDGAISASKNDPDGPRALEPVFEPATFKTPAPLERRKGGGGGDDGGDGEDGEGRRPTLSFPAAIRASLMAVDPTKAIYGQIKLVKDSQGSKDYWGVFKKGVEIDVVSKGEDVFGRPTKITRAMTKKISQLTREDFKGTIPEAQLQAPIRQLRQRLIDQLEESRRVWSPYAAPVSANSSVRVVHFKSYIEMYREKNGADSQPQVETPAPRVPLVVKPEGALKPLSMMLPRAVFLDLDLFDGPISKELVSDMAKLQRTGVYFVAFSRKPYAEANSIKDKLVRQLSSYHLSILMPIRFLAVTDDGAVISAIPKGGNVTPVSVDAFTDSEIDVMRDAAQKAFEDAGIGPRSVRELSQPMIDEAVDEFPGLSRRERFNKKDPQVRFELRFPKTVSDAQLSAWQEAFGKRLKSHGLSPVTSVTALEGGARSFGARKTSLETSMPRLLKALGDRFGLYLNPSDILVLSENENLRKANPNLDFSNLTGLKGADLAENGLGLMLGEHRESMAGDLTGSASRMNQFSYDKSRYLAQLLVEERQAEQNINFFSGHVVHAANDWLVYELQNGRRPTEEQYVEHLRSHWNDGLREVKPVGLPAGEDMEGWLRESTARGLNMYKMVVDIHDRGEVLIGTEIPNFFVVKDYERRSGDIKRRFILHTIFDFVALRPDPKRPGKASLVIYDFKTGPAQSRQKLDKDLQVLTYALFANRKWVGQKFPAPYLSGGKSYDITEARVEFIYGAIKQPTAQSNWDLETIRRKIISTLTRIHNEEQKLLGEVPAKKPARKAKAKKLKKPAAKAKPVSRRDNKGK